MNKNDDTIRKQLWADVFELKLKDQLSPNTVGDYADLAIANYDAFFYPEGQGNATAIFVKKDFEVLGFLHTRLVDRYHENPDTDYMHNLRKIIEKMEGVVR